MRTRSSKVIVDCYAQEVIYLEAKDVLFEGIFKETHNNNEKMVSENSPSRGEHSI